MSVPGRTRSGSADLSQIVFSLLLGIGIVFFLYRYIYSQLSVEFAAKRDENRQKLWDLREQGVALRNEGQNTRDAVGWNSKFVIWRAETLNQAEVVALDLKRSLEIMDKMPHETVRLMHPEHSTNVSIVSEMLVRIKNYLDTH